MFILNRFISNHKLNLLCKILQYNKHYACIELLPINNIQKVILIKCDNNTFALHPCVNWFSSSKKLLYPTVGMLFWFNHSDYYKKSNYFETYKWLHDKEESIKFNSIKHLRFKKLNKHLNKHLNNQKQKLQQKKEEKDNDNELYFDDKNNFSDVESDNYTSSEDEENENNEMKIEENFNYTSERNTESLIRYHIKRIYNQSSNPHVYFSKLFKNLKYRIKNKSILISQLQNIAKDDSNGFFVNTFKGYVYVYNVGLL